MTTGMILGNVHIYIQKVTVNSILSADQKFMIFSGYSITQDYSIGLNLFTIWIFMILNGILF